MHVESVVKTAKFAVTYFIIIDDLMTEFITRMLKNIP